MAERISMSFPASTEYISAIRLAVSGIANVLEYTLDEIEDLKSCVAEACILLLCGQTCSSIQIQMELDTSIKLHISGQDVCPEKECDTCMEFSEEISRIMIEALSEEVVFEEENGILHSISFEKRHTN